MVVHIWEWLLWAWTINDSGTLSRVGCDGTGTVCIEERGVDVNLYFRQKNLGVVHLSNEDIPPRVHNEHIEKST